MKLFTEPHFERTISGFTFDWPDLELRIELQRVNDDAKGEIAVYHQNADGSDILKYSRINLLDSRGVDQLVKSLGTNNAEEIDWQRVMTFVTARTLQALRNSITVENINCLPVNKALTWCLFPLLPENEPTTIFGPGGKCKSLLADLAAVIVHSGVRVPGLSYLRAPKRGNVLILDWERTTELHRQRISAIKKAFGAGDEGEIYYIKCEHPISTMIDAMVKKVSDLDIELVIVDSQMAATAGMGSSRSDAEVSGEYYNCIRRFNCTTLTIDHTTKAGASAAGVESDDSPFGSIVKYNRATSVYRIESDQDSESDIIAVQLRHTKFNLGRRQASRGIEIEFVNEGDQLTEVRFSEFDLADNEKYRKSLPAWQVIQAILREGPKACHEIAAAAKELDPDTRIDAKRAYDTMNKRKQTFAQVKGTKQWALGQRTR